MSGELNLQPFRIPLVDPNTGLITREWSKYLNQLQTRVGGTIIDGGSENLIIYIQNAVAQAIQDLLQQPAPVPVVLPDIPVPLSEVPRVDNRVDPPPTDEYLSARLTEAIKRIEALEQRPV